MTTLPLLPLTRLTDNLPLRIARDDLPPLVVVRRGDTCFVLDDTCSHGEASLADGTVEGNELVCPHHRGAFALASGAATRPPCHQPVRRHPCVVLDGVLYLEWAG